MVTKRGRTTPEMVRDADVVKLQIEVWHPGCWTLEVTEEVGAGLLSGVHLETESRPTCRMTAYGDTTAEVEELVEATRSSPHLHTVTVLNQDYPRGSFGPTPGNATRELLVEKRRSVSQISEAFVSRGFVPAEPIRMEGGVEHWTVLTTLDRGQIRAALDDVREREGARIAVRGLAGVKNVAGRGASPRDRLSVRQREVFELARERGYYAWPRGVSARELADELGITTSTLHEHLRKVEAKLLDGPRER